jgi:hypothetical protein
MSIATLARRFTGSTPSPPKSPAVFDLPALEQRLATAEGIVPDLEHQRRQLLLDADAGIASAAEELARITSTLADARRTADDLRDMVAVARELQAQKDAEAREALRQSQLNAVRQHLRLRDAAAERFEAAQMAAIEAYRDIVEHSEKARAACPVGSKWPNRAFSLRGEIRDAAANELFRLGCQQTTTGAAADFPGGQRDLSNGFHPETAPQSLHAKLTAATTYVLHCMTGDPAP